MKEFIDYVKSSPEYSEFLLKQFSMTTPSYLSKLARIPLENLLQAFEKSKGLSDQYVDVEILKINLLAYGKLKDSEVEMLLRILLEM